MRADKLSVWNGNLRRDFRVRKGLTLEVRLDAPNLQNRSQTNNPDNNPNDTTFGKVTSQTNAMNRFLQLEDGIRL